MRLTVGIVAITCMFGCGLDSEDAGPELDTIAKKCPPDECGPLGNGGGVYTEELGLAGFGAPTYFMLTRFQNPVDETDPNARIDTVAGRGFNTSTQTWAKDSWEIIGVHLDDAPKTYSLVSIHESLSNPTVVLHSSAGNITLTGDDVANRRLTIAFKGAGDFALSFRTAVPEMGTNTTLHKFAVTYNAGDTYNASTAKSYCWSAPDANKNRTADTVMFQEAISVNALTAELGVASRDITLSCRLGAIVTAKDWGYVYRGQPVLFESAMHMKRASYCGDDSFYTVAGTPIHVWDSLGHENDPQTTKFEAAWGVDSAGRNRAICVNPDRLRHPDVTFPPMQYQSDYDVAYFLPSRKCQDGTTIPICTDQDYTHYSLVDWPDP